MSNSSNGIMSKLEGHIKLEDVEPNFSGSLNFSDNVLSFESMSEFSESV